MQIAWMVLKKKGRKKKAEGGKGKGDKHERKASVSKETNEERFGWTLIAWREFVRVSQEFVRGGSVGTHCAECPEKKRREKKEKKGTCASPTKALFGKGKGVKGKKKQKRKASQRK